MQQSQWIERIREITQDAEILDEIAELADDYFKAYPDPRECVEHLAQLLGTGGDYRADDEDLRDPARRDR